MNEPIVITIDGASASGKSTNAKLIAKRLGYVYVDTGAMYRTLAWQCMEKNVDPQDESAVRELCQKWNTALVFENGYVRLQVDGVCPEAEIRTAEISAIVSHIAAVATVRDWMKARQRECVQFGNLVMEGRDIGSNIFPESEFKFYLDASPEERQARRAADGVKEDLVERDRRDSTRIAAPLVIPDGAVLINNSGETPEETSSRIIAEVERQMNI